MVRMGSPVRFRRGLHQADDQRQRRSIFVSGGLGDSIPVGMGSQHGLTRRPGFHGSDQPRSWFRGLPHADRLGRTAVQQHITCETGNGLPGRWQLRASFMLGLLMATMHRFLGGTAEVVRLDASLVHAAGGQPTKLQPPNLRR